MEQNISHTVYSKELNHWFIRLRWIAAGVAFILVLLTIKVLHYLEDRTLLPLLGLIGLLIITNIIFSYLVKTKKTVARFKEIQIGSDLVILTFMLHFSGGIENPLSFVYLFHVILSGILLEKRHCYAVVGFAFFLYASLAFCELSGIIPHYTLQIFPHKELQSHGEAPEAAIEDPHTDHPHSGETTIHASHYPVYVWSLSLLNLFILLLTAYFITNIMDRLRAEESRTREERQRLEHVLQATGAGLLIIDRDLKPVWFNDPVRVWSNIEHAGSAAELAALQKWIGTENDEVAQTMKDGIFRSTEVEKLDENGQKQFFQITIAPLRNIEGEVYQAVELIQDVSEKKLLEAEMLHAAKMVMLGAMAAGIAHEVGNPLASISTRLHLLESERDESFIAQSVRLLQREIARIERIVRGVSQFGRPSPEGWGLCQVSQIMAETVDMLRYHKSAKPCRIELNMDEHLPQVLGVRDQLKQIFLNLGLNAVEAMPEGGLLTIRTRVSRGYLRIEFEDRGSGINPADRENIFQPFFTTKERGSGLGLFIVSHIVQAHGGQIEVNSKPGEGSVFIVQLPLRKTRRPATI